MALNGAQLGNEIADAFGNKSNKYTIAFGNGIVEAVKMGTASYGLIPGPHMISGISGAIMSNFIMAYGGYPKITSQLEKKCAAIADHVMLAGKVTYTGPPTVPPAFPPDWFIGGTISGLSGSVLANLVAQYVGYKNVSSVLLKECGAITAHIMKNVLVTSGVIV